MELTVISITENEKWDAIVSSFAEHDVYYLSGYAKAFQFHGDGEPLLFYCEGEGVRGINVVMKRDIAHAPHFTDKLEENTYFDFATPYGYGGWLIEGDGNRDLLYNEYVQSCHAQSIVSEFMRFNLFSSTREDYYGQVSSRTNNIVRMLDKSQDEIVMDFEYKVRKNLKKAAASGLSMEMDLDGHRLPDFLDIYYSTMERNDAAAAYFFARRFFHQINTLSGNYAYFHVLLDEKVISTELVLMGNGTMYSYLGGTDSRYYPCRPNDFLKYEIIKWGLANGYKRFVLGGGYGADDGILRYKKSFAPDGIIPYWTGQAIFDQNIYDALCRLRSDTLGSDILDSSFFPAYRVKQQIPLRSALT